MPQLGVFFSQPNPVATVVRVAQTAERLGYPAFFVSDHMARDPFVALTACALSTTTITLGTAVLPTFTHHPVAAAVAAASLESLAPGRFIFGIGTSHQVTIEDRLGIPWRRPVAHLREYLQIVTALHRGEDVAFDGEFFRVHYQLPSPPSAPIPIYLGPSRPRLYAMSGELADGVILNWADPTYLAARMPELTNSARAAGRDPHDITICYALFCEVTDSPAATDAARQRFRDQLVFFLQPETYRLRFRAMGFDEEIDRIESAQASDQPVAPLITDPMLHAVSAIGEPDACRARITEYRHSGVDLPLIVPLAIQNGDPAPIERTLTALAAE